MSTIKYILGDISTSVAGAVNIVFEDVYKEDASVVRTALLSRDVLAQGASKEVYKVTKCRPWVSWC